VYRRLGDFLPLGQLFLKKKFNSPKKMCNILGYLFKQINHIFVGILGFYVNVLDFQNEL
jgi:hypothetical protein